MSRPIVVLDIDGVLADFSLAFTQRLVEMGRIAAPVPATAQQTWYFRDSLPITRADEDAVWAYIDGSRTFWRDLRPILDADDRLALRDLAKVARIIYMTGRLDAGNLTLAQTHGWLNLNGLPHGPVILNPDKVDGVAALGRMARVVGIIDDKPATLEAMRDAGAPVTAMDRPYNAHVSGVPRVTSVAAFAAECMEVRNERGVVCWVQAPVLGDVAKDRRFHH